MTALAGTYWRRLAEQCEACGSPDLVIAIIERDERDGSITVGPDAECRHCGSDEPGRAAQLAAGLPTEHWHPSRGAAMWCYETEDDGCAAAHRDAADAQAWGSLVPDLRRPS